MSYLISILQQLPGVGIIIIVILHMRKLRFSKVNTLTQTIYLVSCRASSS